MRLSTVEMLKHKQKRERMQRSILTNIHHRSRMIESVPRKRERESNIIITNLSGKFGKIEHYNRVKRKLIEFLLKFHEN